MEVHKGFYGYPCCPSWLPVVVGNCKEKSISEIWNSKKYQKIRESILDGSFRFCDQKACPKIQGYQLEDVKKLKGRWKEIYENKKTILGEFPEEIALCYDDSCNLSCPSCRSEKILDIRGKTYEEKDKFTNQIIELINTIQNKNQNLLLRVTGSGDPFASPLYFKLLKEIDGTKLPNLQIILQTNGLLLTPNNWEKILRIHNNIYTISISIDAATESTYSQVRRLGSWSKLQNNLKFISSIVEKYQIPYFSLNFVVQKNNYFEMIDFVKMAEKIGNVTDVFFSFLNNWKTWPDEIYDKQCVWKRNHKEFIQFIEILKDPIFDNSIVHLGNLSEYRKSALNEVQKKNW
ncbi:MAG: SPASM domain-containing protein [Bdellovibrionales bacterium]|nr:SPASM domain-containing protein [Bdellovibrionales bacterium]